MRWDYGRGLVGVSRLPRWSRLQRFALTEISSSELTSHNKSWHLPPETPATCQRSEARRASLTVATTRSPRARSCLTNSRPMPLDAPMINHVCPILFSTRLCSKGVCLA